MPRSAATSTIEDSAIKRTSRNIWARRALAAPSTQTLAVVAIAVGAVLRIAQYLDGQSLWLDESLLALNIRSRSLGQLFGALDYDQHAPPAYLVLEKLAVLAFGDGEDALRLVALLAGLASLPLFFLVARRFLSPPAGLFALALFAVLEPVIFHSTEVKQYSTDVAVAIALLLGVSFLLPPRPLSVRRAAAVGLFGMAAVWLSYPSVFFLAGFAVALGAIGLAGRDWDRLKALLAPSSLWLGTVLALYAISRTAVETVGTTFRGGAESSPAFMPLPPDSLSDLKWFGSAAREFVTRTAGLPRSTLVVVAVLFLFGCLSVLRRDAGKGLVLLSPLVAALAASGLEKYPFGGRFSFFYVPCMLCLVAEGAESLVSLLRRLLAGFAPRPVAAAAVRVAGLGVAAFLLVTPAATAAENLLSPRGREEIEPTIEYVQAHWHTGDALYLYYAAQYAFRYYAECQSCDLVDRRGAARELWESVEAAPPRREEFAPALRSHPPHLVVGSRMGDGVPVGDFQSLRGRDRVWVLFSHTSFEAGEKNKAKLLAYLDSLGVRTAPFAASGAGVYLYDLDT